MQIPAFYHAILLEQFIVVGGVCLVYVEVAQFGVTKHTSGHEIWQKGNEELFSEVYESWRSIKSIKFATHDKNMQVSLILRIRRRAGRKKHQQLVNGENLEKHTKQRKKRFCNNRAKHIVLELELICIFSLNRFIRN